MRMNEKIHNSTKIIKKWRKIGVFIQKKGENQYKIKLLKKFTFHKNQSIDTFN